MNEAIAKLIAGDFNAFFDACAADVSLPFQPEALGAIDAIVENDPAKYEWFRAQLKSRTKIRVAVLDMALKARRTTDGAGAGNGEAEDATTAPDERPRLRVHRHSPEKTVAALRDIFAGSGRLYDRGALVRLVVDPVEGGMVAHMMTPPALVVAAHEISRPYVLVKAKVGAKEHDTALPQSIAVMYRDYRDWRLRPLSGIASAPLLTADGSIRTAEGYDLATNLWCENMPDVAGLVPAKPTKDDARAALQLYRSVFRTFCFADAPKVREGGADGIDVVDIAQSPAKDESAFLCSSLTAVCRPSLHLAPGSVFRAPPMSGAGVGKGMLVRCISGIAFGRQPSAIAASFNREEQEKGIVTGLISAGPVLFLDNFNNIQLKSTALASALTERPSRVRIFGRLETVALNAAAFVALTGNGVRLSEDIVRRFIAIELDALMEDPEQRRFAVDVLAEVVRRRHELLVALLTIWRWGRVTEPEAGKPLGSYEQWCLWVRDPLLALGCQDPVKRITEDKKRDPGRQAVAALFDLWWEHHQDDAVKVSELHDDVGHAVDPHGRGRQYVAAYLEKLAGTRVGGYVFSRQVSPSKWSANTYKLERPKSPDEHKQKVVIE
jgi:hypothetical protein